MISLLPSTLLLSDTSYLLSRVWNEFKDYQSKAWTYGSSGQQLEVEYAPDRDVWKHRDQSVDSGEDAEHQQHTVRTRRATAGIKASVTKPLPAV